MSKEQHISRKGTKLEHTCQAPSHSTGNFWIVKLSLLQLAKRYEQCSGNSV